jgi:DNA (cytosine-5)-methyltransferase 1
MNGRTVNFASLFSGCGGFDLGFTAHGFRPCGAFDCNSIALQNYNANNHGPSAVTDLTGGIPNEHQLVGLAALIAGPPCQGFSTAGKRRVDDPRNHLLTLSGALARRIRPQVLVVENVAGALAGEHAQYWNQLNETMRLGGYRTHTIVCQASELGLAQLRRRVLFFAWRTQREINFEPSRQPTCNLRAVLAGAHACSNHQVMKGSREWRIAKRIKPGQKLSNVRGGANAVATWDIPEVFGSVTDHERTLLELLRCLRRRERQRSHGDADPVSLRRLEAALGKPFRRLIDSLLAKGYVRRVAGGVDLVGTFNGKYRRLAWDSPSCTVDTRFGSPRYFLHPDENRGFTVREAARIQGFPDTFVFQGEERDQFRLIGNAVPPPLGSLAAQFTRQLLGA